MKILHRSTVIWNLVLFIMFSFVMLHVTKAVTSETSAFDQELLRTNIMQYKYLAGLFLLTILSIFKLKKVSKLMFVLTSVIMIALTIDAIIFSFSKMILIILFFYTVIAYYNFQFLKTELKESYYNPKFSKQWLFNPMLYKFECVLVKGDKSYKGYLTNWNENGCYVHLDEPKSLKGKFEVKIELDGKEFINKGFVVSSKKGNDGIGLKFYDNNDTIYNWNNFYKITENMGFDPEYLG
jgi:hypothetical protein